MEIGKKFNKLTFKEYLAIIPNYKKYTDFNTLGLYRSIIENEKLKDDEPIKVVELAHSYFKKFFDFLVIKDSFTYYNIITLGRENMTNADKEKVWGDIRDAQAKIIKEKKFGHRNFGNFSKHNCGISECPYNGIMVKKGSLIAECWLTLPNDKPKHNKKVKSERIRKERKHNVYGN